ncbi:hypothetical protein C9J85_15785 [Haloferax sp. wsp5]|nr:hypothetical protein C9J85_15785 [Haloferax sp. wsp5]
MINRDDVVISRAALLVQWPSRSRAVSKRESHVHVLSDALERHHRKGLRPLLLPGDVQRLHDRTGARAGRPRRLRRGFAVLPALRRLQLGPDPAGVDGAVHDRRAGWEQVDASRPRSAPPTTRRTSRRPQTAARTCSS